MLRLATPARLAALLAAALLVTAVALDAPRPRPGAGEREARHGRQEGAEGRLEPSDWFWAQRVNRDGTWPAAKYEAALARSEQLRAETAARAARVSPTADPLLANAGSLGWTNVGPSNVGGRVTAVDAPPGGVPAYLGSANGGVWKSTDGGAVWTCVTDPQSFASIGAVAVDPSDPSTIWVGTGESNGSVDSYDGNGVWRSGDGGATWEPRGLSFAGRIGAVVVDPHDPQHVLVGVMGRQFSTGPDRGLYRTLDGGDTWARVLYVSDSTGVCDVVINPVHPDTVWCATWERVRRNTYRRAYGPECGIWRSTNGGETWARMTTGLPAPSDDVGRIALAVAPSRPRTVYAQIGSGASLGYVGLGYYRSTDGGTTWSKRDLGTTFQNAFGGFVWYFGETGVDPSSADHVYALGVSMLESFDGGLSWGGIGGAMHVDEHALWIDPSNAQHLLIGNDGGLYRTTNNSAFTAFTSLPITQFYDGAVDATNATRVFGGTQDNGSIMTSAGPSAWFSILGGDGFHVLSDPVNPNIVFSEWQFCCSGAGFRRSTSGGPSGGTTTGWTASDRFGWDSPICMDPNNHNVLLAGSNYVYKSMNNGASWTKVSGDLSTNPSASVVYGSLTTLAISPANSDVYWAGTDDGKVWRSSNAGGSWTDVSAGLPQRWVTRVVPDPANAQRAYVTHSGYTSDDQATLVHRTDDQGDHWANVSGNLANVPANDLVVDPLDTSRLYLATDTGVWTSADGGGYWYALGTGLPVQVIADLVLHAGTRQLFAFTHGRSAWSLDLSAMPVAVAPGIAPLRFALSAAWPNPSRGVVTATLDLPRNERVEVAVFDALGRRVATPLSGAPGAGRHAVAWDGRDASGRPARAGVYFLRASAGGATVSRRVVLAD